MKKGPTKKQQTKPRRRRETNRRNVAPRRESVARFEKVFEKIYKLVLRIPRGRVMTYGQIARLLEERYSPRLVGWAMHATPQDGRNIPWHRVINSRGAVSTGRIILHEPDLQRLMLEAEGVVFDDRGHCDLGVYQWSPRQRAARAKLKALGGHRAGVRAKTGRARSDKLKKK
ncbi:MAG TPA: MGMT family protein [Blastocatellia bacterium]|nr:MGMT family protein [Blastocatellia bacterium]